MARQALLRVAREFKYRLFFLYHINILLAQCVLLLTIIGFLHSYLATLLLQALLVVRDDHLEATKKFDILRLYNGSFMPDIQRQIDNGRQANAELFARLKVPCVSLSKSVLSSQEGPQNIASLVANVRDVLQNRTTSVSPALADYVFFPISHLLLRKQNLISESVFEAVIQISEILIEEGWADIMSAKLFDQLFTFLSTIYPNEGLEKANKFSFAWSEGSISPLTNCIRRLLEVGLRKKGKDDELVAVIKSNEFISKAGNLSLGLLEQVERSETLSVRLDVLKTLELLYMSYIEQPNALGIFLPKSASTVVGLLVRSQNTIHHLLVVGVLQFLTQLIVNVLNDHLIIEDTGIDDSDYLISRSKEWLENADAKMSVLLPKLKSFSAADHPQSRQAILDMARELLLHCWNSIPLNRSMLMEYLLHSLSDETVEIRENAWQSISSIAENQTGVDVQLEEIFLKLTEGNRKGFDAVDESKSVAAWKKLRGLISLASRGNFSAFYVWIVRFTGFLGDSLLTQMNTPLGKQPQELYLNDYDTMTATIYAFPQAPVLGKSSVISQAFKGLILAVSSPSLSLDLSQNFLRRSEDSLEIASTLTYAWCSSQMLANVTASAPISATHQQRAGSLAKSLLSLCTYMDLDHLASKEKGEVQICLYLQIISACYQFYFTDKTFFVQKLFPIVQLLFSPAVTIRQHAEICLHNVATYSGSKGIEDLLVKNSDYIINSVGLRLYTFDVSPGLLYTLCGIVQMAGERIIPYLDDIITALFSTMDNFYEYSNLVEAIFAVFDIMVTEIAKKQPLLILKPSRYQSSREVVHRDGPCKDVIRLSDELQQGFIDTDVVSTAVDKSSPKLALPKSSYALLALISQKTNLALSHPSSNVRFKLLSLQLKINPYLSAATVENTEKTDPTEFLPLVSANWPSILSRVSNDDTEAVNAALNVISQLAQLCGNFLSSRFREDFWEAIQPCLNARLDRRAEYMVKQGSRPAI